MQQKGWPGSHFVQNFGIFGANTCPLTHLFALRRFLVWEELGVRAYFSPVEQGGELRLCGFRIGDFRTFVFLVLPKWAWRMGILKLFKVRGDIFAYIDDFMHTIHHFHKKMINSRKICQFVQNFGLFAANMYVLTHFFAENVRVLPKAYPPIVSLMLTTLLLYCILMYF